MRRGDVEPVRAGLIGLGAIGTGIVRLARASSAVTIVGALVRDRTRDRGANVPPVVGSLAELLALQPEVIVEGAGHAALRDFGPSILRGGCDLIALSAGALADPDLLAELEAAARDGRSRMRVASGAIGGLDAISSAAVGGLATVRHTLTKPARTLLGDAADGMREARVIYEGTAREGVQRFPESANVVAAVSLAGIGLDRTELRVVADPALDRNRHVVEAAGEFGDLRMELRNVPSDENPKTGRLTAMSAYRALLARRDRVSIG
ncbi:MAG TPA: aspartate dehydrogenase [Candidatus Limnocylindria bacterium]|nr:aspartate dehydrogenase [Candidatus Limnocylindria bacterium]